MPPTDDVDICIWTHRHSPLTERCARSVIEQTPYSHNLIVTCEPGRCVTNAGRAWKESRSRYIVFVDEDVVFIHPSWLPRFIRTLERHPSYGILTACNDDFISYEENERYKAYASQLIENFKEKDWNAVIETHWTLLFCMIVDKDRVPHLEFDESMPGTKGIVDADICFQALVNYGMKAGYACGTYVYHEAVNKPRWDGYDETQEPSTDEKDAWIRKRWGFGINPCILGQFKTPRVEIQP